MKWTVGAGAVAIDPEAEAKPEAAMVVLSNLAHSISSILHGPLLRLWNGDALAFVNLLGNNGNELQHLSNLILNYRFLLVCLRSPTVKHIFREPLIIRSGKLAPQLRSQRHRGGQMQQSNAAAAALYDHPAGGGHNAGPGSDAGDAVMACWLQSAGLQHPALPLASTRINQLLLPNLLLR
ncbi:unnamed protein product [Camellia sinensis]